MSRYVIRKDSFLVNWLFWSVAVWAAAAVVIVPGAVILMMGTGLFVAGVSAGSIVMGLYVGGMVGLVVGYLQHRVIKHYFYVTDADWWWRSAIAGVPAGAIIVIANDVLYRLAQSAYCRGDSYCYGMYGQTLFPTLIHLMPMVVFIGIVSMAQWSVLRRYVDSAWLWVLSNIVGAVVFGMLSNSRDAVSGWLVATLAQGAVTGAVLLWLFTHRAQPLESPARVPVSVWDEAVQ